ncbi:MAG: pyridoxal phosphate-dependent aminotransferase [Acidobacteria bacterium]|nr:pyridoxal phosphate-dependent aminotransferase [Acidobacteriota bacterium]
MFSSRIKWDLTANGLAGLLAAKRATGQPILDLTESNPTRVGLRIAGELLLDHLTSPDSLSYEPVPRGLEKARNAVAAYLAQRRLEVSPARIHLTASSSEGYSWIFKLLVNQGETVLVPQPSYPLFDFLATLEGVRLIPYQLRYYHHLGWRIDFESIAAALTRDVRAIILVNPNNPTGSFVKKDELARLNHLCQQHHLALIVDEVFSDYAIGDDPQRVESLVGNDQSLTFVLSGLSKVLALPQMKLGWIVTNGPLDLVDQAIERLDLIADTFLSVGTPVQHALPAWLNHRPLIQRAILDRLHTNLDCLTNHPQLEPNRLLRVEGGWYATLEIPRYIPEDELILRLLEQENLLVHPGYFFDFDREAYLIISLLPETDTFTMALDRLLACIAEIGR